MIERAHASPPRTRARARRRWPFWLLGLLGFALAFGIIAIVIGMQLLQARRDLVRGGNDVTAATQGLNLTLLWHDPVARAHFTSSLSNAHREFSRARSTLSTWSPLLSHLSWLPAVGVEIRAAPPAADAAYFATGSALHLLAGLEPVWAASARRNQTPALGRIAPALLAGQPVFSLALADSARSARALRSLPPRSGNHSLDTATAKLRAELPRLQAASTWLRVAPAVLGDGRPTHYLVVLQDPLELRATGGFIGATGYLTLRNGTVHSQFGGGALDHEISSVPPPFPEAVYTFEGPWIFRDSNWSPDGPLSARIERWFYGKDTGRWSDGVISLVDTGIVDLLRATGPVYLPAYAQRVSAANVEMLAQHYVNGSYHGPSRSGNSDAVRKQFLGSVIRAVLQRLQSMPIARWTTVGQAITTLAMRREIFIYDRRPQIEAPIRLSGIDGALRSPRGDFLAIVDDNRSYNKLAPYVRESARYDVTIGADLSLQSTLTLRYHVNPSPDTLEGAGPAFGQWGSKHDFQDFIRVYVPPGAKLLSWSGLQKWAPQPAYGLTQLAGRILVREGHTVVVRLHYRVPANAIASLETYTLTVRHQPGATIPSITVNVHAASGITLGSPAMRLLPLDRDAHLTLPIRGAMHPRLTALPPTVAPVDPYVPFDYFHDPSHPL